MLPYQSLIQLTERDNTPIYSFIARRLKNLIQQGIAAPGSFLPGTREMAATLGVHRNTVTKAYTELITQGWIDAVYKRGFRVIPLPVKKPAQFIPQSSYGVSPPELVVDHSNFADHRFIPRIILPDSIVVDDGMPDTRLAPVAEVMKTYSRLMQGTPVKDLLNPAREPLKESTARFLNETRGVHIDADNVLITRGTQMAIYIAATLLLKPGDEIAVGQPGYFLANGIFNALGVKINYIPVDEQGLDMHCLEEVLKQRDIKLLYIMPNHHHPTTVTLSTVRRNMLLKLIGDYQFWVIEDDYGYDLHYQGSPVLPLASADTSGRVIYVGSYTKVLTPNLRIGYMIAGKALIAQAAHYRKLIDINNDLALDAAVSGIIEDGQLARHLLRARKIYSERCENTSAMLAAEMGHACNFAKPKGGLAIWLKFDDAYPLARLLPELAKRGLLVAGSTYYKGINKAYNHLRFGFASLTGSELEQAVAIFKRTLLKIKK